MSKVDAYPRHGEEARRRSAAYTPPAWLKPGAYADYHSVIGREITKPHLLIQGAPFKAASGTWVVFVRGVSGYVACEALTWPASERQPEPRA